ncbi:MAG: DNA-3-methyladenine glycosylase family protein [Solirubrobacteraceae bacterium]
MPNSLPLEPRGPFSLKAAAEFAFGPHQGRPPADGTMRLAFAVDGGRGYAGAVLRQPGPDEPVSVELALRGDAEPELALAQVARVISLDHDGAAFLRVGDADPVIGALQRAHPGQRPVLFHSPYEAAAWSIISARRPAAQAARVRDEFAIQLGETFELADQTLHAFPQPDHLLELGDQFPGLTLEKLIRLRGVAEAALAGTLDVAALHALGPERAYEEVQRLKGLGPFYAGLVVLRASGFADALLPVPEPKVARHAARFYGLNEPLEPERFAQLAERWRPFRTWATVLIRLAGDRGT